MALGDSVTAGMCHRVQQAAWGIHKLELNIAITKLSFRFWLDGKPRQSGGRFAGVQGKLIVKNGPGMEVGKESVMMSCTGAGVEHGR